MAQDNTAEAELRSLIVAATAGARLPSIRELAGRHRTSPVTIQHLITQLEHEGLVEPKPGRGTFVSARAEPRAGDWTWQTAALGARTVPGEGMVELLADHSTDVISLATGYPDPTLQAVDLLTAAATRAARRPGAWGRSPAQGSAGLRTWFAADIGGGVRPDDIVVISGGQAALSAAFRSLTGPGDPVIIESPTYVGAIDAARLAGLSPVPVPTDHDGVRTDLLDAALRTTGAHLVYLQPHAANPTGITTSAERRREVLELARAHGAFVIEDDYARDLHFDGRAPAPMIHADRDGHVIHVRSLTKSAAPSLRIAALAARGPALRRLRNARLVDDFFVSTMLQETALALVTAPGWSRHLTRLQRAIGERMEVAVTAIERESGLQLTVRPSGGLVLWVAIDDRLDDRTVVRAAHDAGVAVTPGWMSFCSEPPGTYLRLSVAGTDASAIDEGVRRLGTAIRTL